MTTTVFEALADPTRRDLLEQVRRDGPATLTALCTGRPVTRQAVTKHLNALKDAGLLLVTHRGRERIHELQPLPLKEMADFLEPYSHAWDQRLDRLTTYLEENPS
jgi:DNA-binding transcriptional ArsR family regulator